jgi:selenide,water dikinase
VKLTEFARCAGCAAKLGAGDLTLALSSLPVHSDPRLIVGRETFDDAGVFMLSDDLALVQTVDFFAPIVDDPYTFGQIAAANALSDVYAMGGEPLTALNIVGFPAGKLPLEILTEILRGGQDKVREAGAVVVGGHSIIDEELKYGLSVTGRVHPKRVLSNAQALVGDHLVLTKPLGTGLLATAAKRGALGTQETAATPMIAVGLSVRIAVMKSPTGVWACA